MALNLEYNSVGVVIFASDRDVSAGDLVYKDLKSKELSLELFAKNLDLLNYEQLERLFKQFKMLEESLDSNLL